MKVISAKEMARIEKLAYDAGASEEAFMNSAGKGVEELVQRIVGQMHILPSIVILCGSGNNAGDAYVAATRLKDGGVDVVVYALAPLEKSSDLCKLQAKRYLRKKGRIEYILSAKEIDLKNCNLIIDGILGTGFHGKVEGLYRNVIELINESKIPVIAIDVPSGINGTTGEIGGVCIHAMVTLFLGLPKVGCFLGDAWNYTGQISCYNFGLGEHFIKEASHEFTLIDEPLISSIFPPISRTRHKYEAGYVVGLGGSCGMSGAPILSSFAALRAGAGIVRLLHPKGMQSEFGNAPLELICQEFSGSKDVLNAMERACSVFVGPGIGTSSTVLKLLRDVLPLVDKPCVIDADALTLLAHNEISLPKQVVLTPHMGEMKRLLNIETQPSFADFLQLCSQYCEEKGVTLVLKGSPTYIFHPGEKPYMSARGSPGMATAGSGDVLTGIIAAFLARTQDVLKGTLLGVHIHSIAGEHAAENFTPHCMVASDITNSLPEVFAEL